MSMWNPHAARLSPVLAVLGAMLLLASATSCAHRVPGAAASPAAAPTDTPSPTDSPSPSPVPSSPPPSSAPPVAVPAGVTAAYAVFDRQTGSFTQQKNVTMRFRSASLVKLLIALDYLWNRGPGYAIPAADRGRLDVMLRSSDDGAASYFWKLGGYGDVVNRMVPRLDLEDTAPPPAGKPGFWGYTALSAADIVRVYRYLLGPAPQPVRDYVLGNLRQSTHCGTDGYDQSFGIPSAYNRPWAVKQGWSGFGGTPAGPCASNPAVAPAVAAVPAAPAGTLTKLAGIDLVHKVLHTTGVVGTGDRTIVVVLTLQPDGTPYARAAATLTQLARSLRAPGGSATG